MERINPGLQVIWDGFVNRLLIACQPEADRFACSASLAAHKAMAYGAYCVLRSADPVAWTIYQLISKAEMEYWLQDPQ